MGAWHGRAWIRSGPRTGVGAASTINGFNSTSTGPRQIHDERQIPFDQLDFAIGARSLVAPIARLAADALVVVSNEKRRRIRGPPPSPEGDVLSLPLRQLDGLGR